VGVVTVERRHDVLAAAKNFHCFSWGSYVCKRVMKLSAMGVAPDDSAGVDLETEIRGFSDSVTDRAEVDRPAVGEGQLIVVRPQVVESVGHVLGNLFQRIYHLLDEVGAGAPTAATALADSTRRLEDFLQVVIDYFSPVSLGLQYLPAPEVAQGLAREISDALGCSVRIDARVPADARLLADPGRLSRCFALLVSLLSRDTVALPPDLRLVGEAAARSLKLTVSLPTHVVPSRSTEAEVRWAVVEKLLEVHGGTVRETHAPSGGVLWEIVLPLQS